MRDDLLQWIEVDLEAIRSNLSVFRGLVPDTTQLMMVIKANAYGHGLELVARNASALPIDVLGVHSLQEAERARQAGWAAKIYVLGYIAAQQVRRAHELDVDITIVDETMLNAVVDAVTTGAALENQPLRCHLKLETGTHRQGMSEEEAARCIRRIDESPRLTLAGTSMHFANIEDTTDQSYARRQLENFCRLTDRLKAERPELVRHTACSAAALTLGETAFDLIRVGIGAYGYWPSRETQVTFRNQGHTGNLRPALTWKARIGQVRDIASGSYIGYGCSERVERDTKMAVLPVGYSDGFDRGLSRVGHVLVRGRRARVLGRVCMNILMVDVTDVGSVEPEEEVILLGRSGDETIDAAEMGALIQTISYEVLARLSQAVDRFAVPNDG